MTACFCLCVGDFGVKYFDKDNTNHLLVAPYLSLIKHPLAQTNLTDYFTTHLMGKYHQNIRHKKYTHDDTTILTIS